MVVVVEMMMEMVAVRMLLLLLVERRWITNDPVVEGRHARTLAW